QAAHAGVVHVVRAAVEAGGEVADAAVFAHQQAALVVVVVPGLERVALRLDRIGRALRRPFLAGELAPACARLDARLAQRGPGGRGLRLLRVHLRGQLLLGVFVFAPVVVES